LVLGARPRNARLSERFLNWLTNFRLKTNDPGTGFRALRWDLAPRLELKGRCICGISALEPAALGARITEVQNFGRGPLIARVRDARIALGRGEAGRIYVHRRRFLQKLSP
jgi:hypothetical protein